MHIYQLPYICESMIYPACKKNTIWVICWEHLWKGVSATLRSGRYTLSYPRGWFVHSSLLYHAFRLTIFHEEILYTMCCREVVIIRMQQFHLVCTILLSNAKWQYLLICKVSSYAFWLARQGPYIFTNYDIYNRLVQMTTNLKPTIYRNLYENTGSV